jgi:hypothetical protein
MVSNLKREDQNDNSDNLKYHANLGPKCKVLAQRCATNSMLA